MPSVHSTAALILALAVAASAQPVGDDAGQVGLTIYSTADPSGFDPQHFLSMQRLGHNPQYASEVPGFGVVRDTRLLKLEQGANRVRFTDVAQFIDPTTVNLVDLSVPPDAPADAQDQLGIRILEQEFQFDLVSPSKLLDKYIDQMVTVNVPLGDGRVESVQGTLLANNQGRLVLKTDAGLRILSDTGDVRLGPLPEGLITRPTLQWRLLAPKAGDRRVRTSYQTDGLTWRADYNLVVNSDDTRADVSAWVTTLNLSGARYQDARLKLIAGDVQRIQPPRPRMEYMARGMAMAVDQAAGFEEKPFFEYHMYTLPRLVTIENNSTQQIALFPTIQQVAVEKVLVYYGLPEAAKWFFPDPRTDRDLGSQSNKKVDVYIRLENKEENRMGIPLPRGKVRVYKLDAAPAAEGRAIAGDGALEFVGEDLIDHTARNETVLVKLGQAFDVTGERVQTDFKVDTRAHWMEETIRITVSNAKDKPQKVIIRENLYRWVNWQITKASDDYRKIDSRTVHMEVVVPADGKKTVEYTVKYTW